MHYQVQTVFEERDELQSIGAGSFLKCKVYLEFPKVFCRPCRESYSQKV